MQKTLLLDVYDKPLAVISARRALGLVLAEKAVLIKANKDALVRSATRSFALPSVVRLRYYVHAPQRKVHWSRMNVLRRDNFTCQFCGTKVAENKATVDHLVPVSKCKKMGINPNTWSNTVACCVKCQRRKADRSKEESGMKFHDPTFEPKLPRVSYLVFTLKTGNVDEEWRKYIQL